MPFALWALIVSAAAARIASRLARNRFVPPSSLWDTGCAPCIAPDYQLRFEGTVAFCTPARLARSNASGDAGGRRGGFTEYRVWTRLDSKRHGIGRSEEHTSELQSLMRISYAVFCLKKKKTKNHLRL